LNLMHEPVFVLQPSSTTHPPSSFVEMRCCSLKYLEFVLKLYGHHLIWIIPAKGSCSSSFSIH